MSIPATQTAKQTAKTPKKLRKGIKLDRVDPIDFSKRNPIYCCEQCSHYDPEADACTLGYQARLHKKDIQLQRYYLHGHMAFCRFTEID
jgi:hypothetical protein